MSYICKSKPCFSGSVFSASPSGFLARDGWRCAGAWLLRAGQTAYERHELPAPWLTCRDAAVFFRLIAVHGLGRPKRDAQKHALASADSNRRGD
ncbi:hypothetical protein QNK09_13600 [Brevibacillus agri]|uniref:hypothetical protein n=1 Tax=Brevibacillus agri TaxID=51101 RepID=UPI0024BFBD84|nr:hypothetical protein [Brevibacillus agri]WHX33182.1 hypothetical protein QNK09_13600 [Brevibacillus agri]